MIARRKSIFEIFLWASLNIITAQIPELGCILAIIEHLIVLSLIACGNIEKAFKYYLIFVTVSLEVSSFVMGSSKITYSYFNIPLVHGMLYVIELLCMSCLLKSFSKTTTIGLNCLFLSKWINVLFFSGILCGFLTMALNDNGVLSSGYYPYTFIIQVIGFIPRFCFYQTAIVLTCRKNRFQELSYLCCDVYIGLVFASVIFAILGYHGYYGDDSTMLSSLAMGLSPCILLLAFFECNKTYKSYIYIATFMAIVSSFFYPSVVGSKWYLIVMLVVICYVYKVFGFKSSKYFLFFCMFAVFLLPLITDTLLSITGTDSYIGYKLRQSLGVLNYNNVQSADEFMAGMGESPMFRFDELHNTLIEYLHKPYYALFGKGFGGTTQHYTDLLSWETAAGAFSKEQINMHAYHTMHETLAQVFLTHGFIGVWFVFALLYKLIKSLSCSGWSIFAFLFIFFYWNYGAAFSIGTIAVVLSLYKLDNSQKDGNY